MNFKIALTRMSDIYIKHNPDEIWRVRAEDGNGKDYNAVGSTPEQAMDRLIAFMRGRHAFDEVKNNG